MYSANVFSIQQWGKSANTSKAASSSVAEKWAVPSGLPVTQLLLWSWTREVDSQFLSLAKLMLLLNCSSITSTCEKGMILLVINYTDMEFRSGMIGDYCSWQRLCRSLQTCANKIFILLTKKKKKKRLKNGYTGSKNLELLLYLSKWKENCLCSHEFKFSRQKGSPSKQA